MRVTARESALVICSVVNEENFVNYLWYLYWTAEFIAEESIAHDQEQWVAKPVYMWSDEFLQFARVLKGMIG
jgi:hypothetical protein